MALASAASLEPPSAGPDTPSPTLPRLAGNGC
jgi:hypothetical protein